MISRSVVVLAGLSAILLAACAGGRDATQTAPSSALRDGSMYENAEWGYRFYLPAGALLEETSDEFPDSFSGNHLVQFAYAGNTYEIRAVRTYTHKSIEQWLKDPNAQKAGGFSEYTESTVDDKPAYQWSKGLITTFMFGNSVFEISGAETGAMTVSSNRDDAIFQELIASFQMIKN